MRLKGKSRKRGMEATSSARHIYTMNGADTIETALRWNLNQ